MLGATSDRYALYAEEKALIKAEFAGLENIDWSDPAIRAKLHQIAKQVIKNTTDQVNQNDLISAVLPTERINPGETLVVNEISGMAIYTGSYGAAVRMSRPQFTSYSAKPNLKEVGIRLDLVSVQAGKYSVSELADYTNGLINAWRNRMLFVNTLAGMTAYQSGGAQYTAGGGVSIGTIITAMNTLTDESEIKVIVGRRNAIAKLSSNVNYSNDTRREWETRGQVGTYAGIPVIKVNSFTDNDYGVVYPFDAADLWMFSDLPAGRAVIAGALRTSDEVIPQTESMNIYMRWDDGIGIWHTDRISRIVTS
ncbi:hypothetical protein M0R04_05785 [Candidatus Dojkabacteria bacterium]|nr:hypothetical protein [Candidatus Dojkabacteria bacterium]